jgi:S-adenosylmethionine synthetase
VSVRVESFGSGRVADEKMVEIVRAHFGLKPKEIIESLDLRRPIYLPTAAFGHFGRTGAGFTWEKTDRADALRRAAGLGS